jgi:hypothetical protein
MFPLMTRPEVRSSTNTSVDVPRRTRRNASTIRGAAPELNHRTSCRGSRGSASLPSPNRSERVSQLILTPDLTLLSFMPLSRVGPKGGPKGVSQQILTPDSTLLSLMPLSRTSEPVKDVMAERMTLREQRMLKVVIGRTGHPDTLHYVSGTLVSWNSKRRRFARTRDGQNHSQAPQRQLQ